jgi:hypothetical protein
MLTETQNHKLQHDVLHCHDCRVWDPENQPSVLANFARDPHFYDEELFWQIPNGTFFVTLHGDKIPLWTEFMLCQAHKAEYRTLDQDQPNRET